MSLQKLNSIALFVLLSFAGYGQENEHKIALGKPIEFQRGNGLYEVYQYGPQPFVLAADTSDKILLFEGVELKSEHERNNTFYIPDSLNTGQILYSATLISGKDSIEFEIKSKSQETFATIYNSFDFDVIIWPPERITEYVFDNPNYPHSSYFFNIQVLDIGCSLGITPVIDSFHVRLVRSGELVHDFYFINSSSDSNLPSDFTIIGNDVMIIDKFHSHDHSASITPRPSRNKLVFIATEPEGYPEADSGKSED